MDPSQPFAAWKLLALPDPVPQTALALISDEQIGPYKDWSFIWSVSHLGLKKPMNNTAW